MLFPLTSLINERYWENRRSWRLCSVFHQDAAEEDRLAATKRLEEEGLRVLQSFRKSFSYKSGQNLKNCLADLVKLEFYCFRWLIALHFCDKANLDRISLLFSVPAGLCSPPKSQSSVKMKAWKAVYCAEIITCTSDVSAHQRLLKLDNIRTYFANFHQNALSLSLFLTGTGEVWEHGKSSLEMISTSYLCAWGSACLHWRQPSNRWGMLSGWASYFLAIAFLVVSALCPGG